MGTFLPWWLLAVPAILVLADSMFGSKTSSMGGARGVVTPGLQGRAL